MGLVGDPVQRRLAEPGGEDHLGPLRESEIGGQDLIDRDQVMVWTDHHWIAVQLPRRRVAAAVTRLRALFEPSETLIPEAPSFLRATRGIANRV